MSKVDPSLALGLWLVQKWDTGSELPAAINTIRYGYASGMTQEVLLSMGHLEELAHKMPQVMLEQLREDRLYGANADFRDIRMKINVAVPKRYNSINTKILLNWSYQIGEHIKRLMDYDVHGYRTTALTSGANAVYGFRKNIESNPEDTFQNWYIVELWPVLEYRQ